ncbi:MAG: bifunctional hydroxymethylpyrimidine kinase/phosphomethylpyrimidine kinase [Dehalococcoidales bacterium]|nr:bifunctional hydroxymethylpyrimidine kinase/phosphomethylpyrimidine kinase [Dehalococcoidales bacterium]
MLPICMTIAGSDSGGGAGIQADLKTFASLKCYGVSVITSVTAQNTKGVDDIHIIPKNIIKSQIIAINNDMNFKAVKTGMLPDENTVVTVSNELQNITKLILVVDPVIVATSGDILVSKNAIESIKTKLLPLASVITPNLLEAEALTGVKINNKNELFEACEILKSYGPKSVLIKGGHFFESEFAEDTLYDGKTFEFFSKKRIKTTSTHGTGCTFSSAITAFLANDKNLIDSVNSAKSYVTNAINKAYKIGEGNGPLNHFYI